MKTIRLLGLGISLYDALPVAPQGIEVWGLQYTWKTHKLDRAFVMDDEDWILAKNNNLGNDISKEINSFAFPVYVSKPWATLDNWNEFPLEQVASFFPNLKHRVLKRTERGEEWEEVMGKYFLNSYCYMLALAIVEGFERIEIYGMDMSNNNGRNQNETWEDERACVSYWIGVAVGRGIEVVIPKDSRLTKPISQENPNLYGYQTSRANQDIRSKVLKEYGSLTKALDSIQPTTYGNDRIIDLTKTGVKFAVFHKEDMPEGAKTGDVVVPKAEPYAVINEKLDKN